MDAQQIIALSIVAAAAILLVIRQVRRRRTAKFSECANCAHSEKHSGTPTGGKRAATDHIDDART